MTSHWPTFADGLFWCACDNRTFDTEEAWQAHVVDRFFADELPAGGFVLLDSGTVVFTPSESADRNPQPGR